MDKSKKEKLIILGRSGSGKDFLLRKLTEKGLKPCLKWTTRPPRKFEEQGVTYNFVTDTEFIQSINENNFLAYQEFNVTPEGKSPEKWYYGITKEEFHQSQIFIMTPGEFNNITVDQRKGCFVVYLDIPRDVRESRLFKRADKNDSIKRRLDTDEDDFRLFGDYDLRVTDPEFTADDVYDLMD
jgi:guanylate kinase